MRESDLIRESQRILFNAIRTAFLKNKDANIQTVNGAIVNALPILYESTEREPNIIPMILST